MMGKRGLREGERKGYALVDSLISYKAAETTTAAEANWRNLLSPLRRARSSRGLLLQTTLQERGKKFPQLMHVLCGRQLLEQSLQISPGQHLVAGPRKIQIIHPGQSQKLHINGGVNQVEIRNPSLTELNQNLAGVGSRRATVASAASLFDHKPPDIELVCITEKSGKEKRARSEMAGELFHVVVPNGLLKQGRLIRGDAIENSESSEFFEPQARVVFRVPVDEGAIPPPLGKAPEIVEERDGLGEKKLRLRQPQCAADEGDLLARSRRVILLETDGPGPVPVWCAEAGNIGAEPFPEEN